MNRTHFALAFAAADGWSVALRHALVSVRGSAKRIGGASVPAPI